MTISITTLALAANEQVLGVLLIILMLTVVLLAILSPWIRWFRRELKFINTEIQRNTGREQQRWLRRRRRLWMSVIPFVKYE